jgi:hypothetical protein
MNRIFLFGFVFLLFPLNSSFGATPTQIGDDVFIFVQTTVRNADGQLVVYLESTKFTDLNLSEVKSFLDSESLRAKDPIVTIDGIQYQVIRRMQSHTFETTDLVASTILAKTVDDKSVLLARFAHDGYPVIAGDTLQSMWTFIRPVA